MEAIKTFSQKVVDFRKESVEIIGNYKQEMFDIAISNEIYDYEITSPIEQMLLIALHLIKQVNSFPNAQPTEINKKYYSIGLNISPQYIIAKYRIDFSVSYGKPPQKNGNQFYQEVLIECDSQQFHERTEAERRYEKKRDRFLQTKGYKIFHYTGKEIKNDPFKIAAEILSYLTGLSTDVLIDYSYIPE